MDDNFYQFLEDGVTFVSQKAAAIRTIYCPLCGPDSVNLKSSISPYLSGDIKLDKMHYLTKPVSREDLRLGLRDFFVKIDNKDVFSLSSREPEDAVSVEIGQLWHKVTNYSSQKNISLEAVNFIPASGDDVELMCVTVQNHSEKDVTLVPTFSIPLFARSLSNKHDHEHVTSLLNRVQQIPEGVLVEPTMVFNEEGHQANAACYYAVGFKGDGSLPQGSFPTVESFLGAGGTLSQPEAVFENKKPVLLSDESLQGKEVMGAIRFKQATLVPGQSLKFVMAVGMSASIKEAKTAIKIFDTHDKFEDALQANIVYWREKISALEIQKGNENFNAWFRWVTIQPILRRIFGCSFLPDHDYGKGGRGWRDLWQDLLSLILIEPQRVRQTLINNFAGVRIDGSNATIIGETDGEFIGDRNAITRVWMDHGTWPFQTILLYLNQTGDFDILDEEVPYFKDAQLSRTLIKDNKWSPGEGNALKDETGQVIRGTILEHILIQTLVQFFNVGEHNLIRLESADWNDGLDMAFERGESVAFSCFYAGNILDIADMLEYLQRQNNLDTLVLAKEVKILFDSVGAQPCDYGDYQMKKSLLFDQYCCEVQANMSGEKEKVSVRDVIQDLRKKGKWLMNHIRQQEVVSVQENGQEYKWFNGYYDNQGVKLEGKKNGRIFMTLTGQVFPLMSGVSTDEESLATSASVQNFLKDKILGGYRLNTDFGVRYYLDLGRAFGFAYGTKENGAFFSHMDVMYAYALYKRGLVRQGFDVLDSIYKMSLDTEKSKIYPNIPEYFDRDGQGLYCYLTGAASWLVLTQVTQVFGVRGIYGDLLLSPKLVKEEFSANQEASVYCQFAGKKISVTYQNPNDLDWGDYVIKEVRLNGNIIECEQVETNQIRLKRDILLSMQDVVNLNIILSNS